MRHRIVAALLSFFILFAAAGLAQEDRAVVTGSVTDPSHAVISGASVEIANKATGFHRVVTTNDSGSYFIPGLLVGFYELTVSKTGFRTEEFQSFELVTGQIRTIDTEMNIASGTQEVSVSAAAAPLEESSSTVGGVIDSAQVANLPLNGRAWTSLMALVPGAINSGGGTAKTIRFAGRGLDDNNFRFDGVDATGIRAQAPDAAGRLQISTEAIAEFKVDTMLYGADTGGTNGGQVEVISKSGSNDFHGSAFEYLRNDAISARGPFDPSTLPPLRLNQYGASAGGAIVKNRTFFFVAYEGLRQRVGTTLIGNVPSDSFRAAVLAQSPALAPIINSFPLGNRLLSANVSRYYSTGTLSSNEDSGFVRIDHRITDSTNFFARYNIDKVQNASPSGHLLDRSASNSSPLNGTMSLSHVFSPTMFNVFVLGANRINAVQTTNSSFFAQSGVVSSVSIPGFDTLNSQRNSVSAPTTYSLKDDFSWTRGAHSIKAGIEIKRVLYNYSQPPENNLIFSSLANFQANKLDQVNLLDAVPMHGLDKTMDFGYIEDAWKVRSNFTLNIGLRYEFFNVFHEDHGRDLPFDLATCGGYCPVGSQFTYPVTNNLEPRVSFAWSPAFLGKKTVIRSGFGIYKGEGQLGDLNAPSDNFAQRLAITSSDFPNLSFPANSFYQNAATSAVSPRGLSRNRQDPTVQQWGLQLQTELPAGFILDTGYIGYHGYHQFYRDGENLINPLTGQRPLPGFGPIDNKSAVGDNHFDGWQTSLQRQFRSGVSFTANYMWSHAINDGSNGGGEGDYPQNNACRVCEIASSDFDVRHTFTANTVYNLPFGKGRQYLNGGGRLSDFFLGGWQFSGLGTFRSGNPVNIFMERPASALPDGNSVLNGTSFQRPNYNGGISIVPTNQSINNWINPLAFSTPANGTYGNAGRNLARGPAFWQADMALVKNFPIHERFSIDFRAEAFNIFNRAQFGDPNGDFSSPSFGQITTTVNNGSITGGGTPREFQFSLRLRF